MSANQFVVDAATRHQVFLQRFAGGESKKAISTLNRLRGSIKARLLQENDIIQAQRISIILEDINLLYADFSASLKTSLKVSTRELARAEVLHSANLYNKVTKIDWTMPADAALIAAVDNTVMSVGKGLEGFTIDAAITKLAAQQAQGVSQIILDGVTLGDVTQNISNEVSALINTVQRRHVNTLVNTAVNHAASIGRDSMYNANADIIEGYEWVSTLDSRTSLICGKRDGKIYPIGVGAPLPPAHFSCRSTTIPKVKKELQVTGFEGDRPAIGAHGVENVSANKSYGGWLKTQPREFVDEALGVERSKLFRSGKLTIDKFTDPTGRVYTLPELETMT